jgi:hypothetical protein
MIREDYYKTEHKYSLSKSNNYSELAFLRNYNLYTADSFEIGGAYSLHLDQEQAVSFKPESWWGPIIGRNEPIGSNGIKKVFVSSKTLEALTKDEDKVIFASFER